MLSSPWHVLVLHMYIGKSVILGDAADVEEAPAAAHLSLFMDFISYISTSCAQIANDCQAKLYEIQRNIHTRTYKGADCNLNRWNLWNSLHINSSRVFISIIFYDAALIKKHDTLLHLSLFMEYFIQFFITTIIIVFAYFSQPNSHSPPLACVALNESLKCKYINTKLLYEYLACPNWHFGLCFIAKGAPK